MSDTTRRRSEDGKEWVSVEPEAIFATLDGRRRDSKDSPPPVRRVGPTPPTRAGQL